MVDKYGTGQDPYTYDGSAVLKNLLNIQNEQELDEAERDISLISAMDIEFSEPAYDLEYWCALHHGLFHDIYEWAGTLRTIDISKGNTHFCNIRFLESNANKLFNELESENYLCGISRAALVQRISYFYSELNVIHPFRDGNGRAQRLLFEHIVINCGYEISFEDVEIDEWIDANIQGYEKQDYSAMQAIFEKCIGIPL